MDAVTRVEEAVALAAYIQAIVKLYSERYDAGHELPFLPSNPCDREQVAGRSLRSRSARHGPHDRNAGTASPVAQLVRRTLRDIEPHARELRIRARA